MELDRGRQRRAVSRKDLAQSAILTLRGLLSAASLEQGLVENLLEIVHEVRVSTTAHVGRSGVPSAFEDDGASGVLLALPG